MLRLLHYQKHVYPNTEQKNQEHFNVEEDLPWYTQINCISCRKFGIKSKLFSKFQEICHKAELFLIKVSKVLVRVRQII